MIPLTAWVLVRASGSACKQDSSAAQRSHLVLTSACGCAGHTTEQGHGGLLHGTSAGRISCGKNRPNGRRKASSQCGSGSAVQAHGHQTCSVCLSCAAHSAHCHAICLPVICTPITWLVHEYKLTPLRDVLHMLMTPNTVAVLCSSIDPLPKQPVLFPNWQCSSGDNASDT